jgi:hypothetical protein
MTSHNPSSLFSLFLTVIIFNLFIMVVPTLVEIALKFIQQHPEQLRSANSLPRSLQKALFTVFVADKSITDDVVHLFFEDDDSPLVITDLDLSHCHHISDQGVSYALCRALRSLDLRGTTVNGSFLSSLDSDKYGVEIESNWKCLREP